MLPFWLQLPNHPASLTSLVTGLTKLSTPAMASQDSQASTWGPAAFEAIEGMRKNLSLLQQDLIEEEREEAQAACPVTPVDILQQVPAWPVYSVPIEATSALPPHFNLAEEFKSMNEHFAEINKNMGKLVQLQEKSF